MKRKEVVATILGSSPGEEIRVRLRGASPRTPWLEYTSLDDLAVSVEGPGVDRIIRGVKDLMREFAKGVEYEVLR